MRNGTGISLLGSLRCAGYGTLARVLSSRNFTVIVGRSSELLAVEMESLEHVRTSRSYMGQCGSVTGHKMIFLVGRIELIEQHKTADRSIEIAEAPPV